MLLFLACAMLMAMVCEGCSPRRASTGRKKDNVDYAEIKKQSEPMLQRIVQHANALAAFGPRQTGQAGCDKAFAYIKDKLAEAAPGAELSEISTTVTVPLDRLGATGVPPVADRRDGCRTTNTHIEISSLDAVQCLTAYSLFPNCAQACQTHKKGSCGGECENCERPRRLVDLKSGTWDDFNGKDLKDVVVLLDFNSGDAWLRAASLGAYGAIFVEPDETTVFQADLKYLSSLPLHFPRLYVKKPVAEELRRYVRATSILSPAGSCATGETPVVSLCNRLKWTNVTARGVELTIPGKDRSYAMTLAAHFDARSIVPDLSYGASEVWGVGELLELVRYYSQEEHKPNCDLHIMFVSGHWQNQQLMRDYLAADSPAFKKFGKYYRVAMGVDLVPQGQGINMISESMWDQNIYRSYNWLDLNIGGEDGWKTKTLEGLGLMKEVPSESSGGRLQRVPAVELFAGARPTLSNPPLDDRMADRNNRSPMMFAPRYTTAEEAWQAYDMPTFAFQTTRLARLAHNTPLDTMEHVLAEARVYADANCRLPIADFRLNGNDKDNGNAADQSAIVVDQLRPQLQMTMAMLGHLLNYPPTMVPESPPAPRSSTRVGGGNPLGGYSRIHGRILQWDRSIGWFAERLPGVESPPLASTTKPGRDAGDARDDIRSNGMQTFVHAYPSDVYINRDFSRLGERRVRNYRARPVLPMTGQHRELQCFTFQDFRLLDRADFQLNAVYAAWPETQYDLVGYSVDSAGRLCYATDYGIHGDGNKAFQCTEVPLDGPELFIPVSLFECGSLELFDLTDITRYNPRLPPADAWLYNNIEPPVGPRTGHINAGTAAVVRVQTVKDVRSHTEIERWGFSQYASTAMVFLPAAQGGSSLTREFVNSSQPTSSSRVNESTSQPVSGNTKAAVGAEILLGGYFTNFSVLNNPDESGQGRGYSLRRGESLRLSDADKTTPANAVRQLATLDATRIKHFAQYDVSSPLAKRYQKESAEVAEAADAARQKRDYQTARANDLRSWTLETLTYRNTLGLLMDVVSTTVLYFVLLIPFSFLIERLIFPQRTALRTVLVSIFIFSVFACILYMFHPGFKLAHNILVITIAFIIVVMSVPALVLLLVRGVAMLRAMGSNAVITQRSEAESAGVVMASLSLAVSNMRRRKLRTALTLSTITILVMALVLLTTSSAFDFSIMEPTGAGEPSYQGIQIYNTQDRRMPLIPEMAEVYQRAMEGENRGSNALVLLRQYVNYGYGESENHCMYLTNGQKRERLLYFQVMDERDNLIQYDAPKILPIAQKAIGRAQTPEGTKIRLSDLIDGRFFEKGDVEVCLLPSAIADKLGAKVGDTVRVMGMPLKVIGIWLSEFKMDSGGQMVKVPGPIDSLKDLDGLSIMPPHQSQFRQSMPDSPTHAPSSKVVIVPKAWIDRYHALPLSVESLVIVPAAGAGGGDSQQVLDLARRLAREILNVDVYSYFKDADGVGHSERLSMRTATQIKGSSMMLIVLGVAVLMILAIMTGTVYERMKEIHIFSSVGLSPRHIAGMFFVEALVFAGIASVLGYFLGVIALKALLGYLKSMPGQKVEFYPNYLGVFVLYSIGVAVLATLASSLYPIRLASRIVNPSAGKTFQFTDEMSGDAVSIKLPFIATNWLEARGMMVYAYDFLAIHQGERSGRFVCEKPPAGSATGDSMRLEMPVWLAPFERNLSQYAVLKMQPTADGAWWEMSLDLRRTSGQEYLWKRGATVFVNMLCKHLLRWRAVSAEQEAQTAQRAEAVYGS